MTEQNLDRIEQDKFSILIVTKGIHAGGGGEFTIWQSLKDQRTIAKGKLMEVNLHLSTLTFRPILESQFNFQPNLPLYFKDNENGILFKTKIKFVNKGNILTELPKEIRAQELRKDRRHVVLDNFLKPSIELNYINNYNQKKMFHDFKIIDISNQGLAFLINRGNLTKFRQFDLIECLKIGGIELKDSLATIKNVSQFIDKKSVYKDSYRVGINFNHSLPNQIINNIIGKDFN